MPRGGVITRSAGSNRASRVGTPPRVTPRRTVQELIARFGRALALRFHISRAPRAILWVSRSAHEKTCAQVGRHLHLIVFAYCVIRVNFADTFGSAAGQQLRCKYSIL